MNFLGSALAYLGLGCVLAGALSILKPLTFLRIGTRPAGVAVLAGGLLLTAGAMVLPVAIRRVERPSSQLDVFVPAYQFAEFHEIRIRAPRDRVYRALREVTANEITLFRTLTWIRRLGREGPESILNAPENVPLLDVATRTSFLKLAEVPEQEIVVGTLVAAPPGFKLAQRTPEAFAAIEAAGFAKAAMNFRLEDEGANACVLTTETRIYATDDATRRRFAAYWRVIYPGSALIRIMWLRAVRRRAEAVPRGQSNP